MKELMILLPAYNEEMDLEKMIKRWLALEETIGNQFQLSLRVVIINDGSKDRTREIAQRLCEEHNNVILLNHSKNKGLGEAVKTGFLYAIQKGQQCDYVCVMDCDNTQNPEYILSMLKKAGADGPEKKADVVIASRYQKGAKVKGLSEFRRFTSQGARVVYQLGLRVPGVRDYTCGYRLYTREALKKLLQTFGLHMVEERGFTCMAEILYKLYRCGVVFAEVPFELRYDKKAGVSKMRVGKTAMDSLKLVYRLRKA